MTGEELNQIYGSMIMPNARVDVPEEWMPAVHEAMRSFVDLPSEVRMFVIVIGIVRDAEGDVTFEVASADGYLTEAGFRRIREITDRAHLAVSGIKGTVH
ncbi:hypothetical protein [Rhizobium sp. Leaf383]|uniref:hypothetical protein n=1 Tax=Rhizobium sp. Leaf383 TaxID=1736357 RepID=UPI0007151966|nr:hypothetical protein [Rhizobium sp. Leaf383]KQS84848.1 hypothetical protein ASG58_20360 [Rhizobium sp. Leaf383]